VSAVTTLVTSERLVVRDWEPTDVSAALAVFGDERVSRWLAPAIDPVPDEAAMAALLRRWAAEQHAPGGDVDRFVGRWALARREDGVVVGGLVLRTMPPHDEDLEIAWQLAPEHWGKGYASEGARALARWAFAESASEVFAVIRPGNDRAAWIARRLGMEWVGETSKYYDLDLTVYRLRPSDLAGPAPVAADADAEPPA
jgi:[ribosomal protein S5]-alanine N-acetyltransferase